MVRHGLIYDSSWNLPSGETIISKRFTSVFPIQIISVTREKRAKLTRQIIKNIASVKTSPFAHNLLRGASLGLITASILGAVLSLQPIIVSEISYRTKAIIRAIHPAQAQQAHNFTNQLVLKEQRAQERAKALAKEFGIENTDFYIYIPKINARSSVIQDVNAANEEEYTQALKTGVAHAAGTSLPGMHGGTYIFAHSTSSPTFIAQYNAVFYLLRELSPEDNDEVYLFFQDKVYKYRIAEKHVTEADDVTWLTHANEGPERLILQTCWPPGTTWKRLIIVAYPDMTFNNFYSSNNSKYYN